MDCPSLATNLRLQFLAEGAANIVYRLHYDTSIKSKQHSEENASTDGSLLRLRKDYSSRVPVEQSHADFRSVFQHILPEENLVKQQLIRISAGLLEDCNADLRKAEANKIRKSDRSGLYLARETHGLLISDMTPNDSREVLLEFKPKWLVQSPSAPVDSKRCRTCALRARKNSRRRERGDAETQDFCPIDLRSKDEPRQLRAVRIILKRAKLRLDDVSIEQRVLRSLNDCGVLDRLAELQRRLDPFGVLNTDLDTRDFRTAMTLRDCTLFMKISLSREAKIDLRLGDLDLKSPKEGKGEHWTTTERQLVDEGWYHGLETGSRSSIEDDCGFTKARPRP